MNDNERMAREVKKCSGFRTSGYWKGWPCGSVPKYQSGDGKFWCKNHLPIDRAAIIKTLDAGQKEG